MPLRFRSILSGARPASFALLASAAVFALPAGFELAQAAETELYSFKGGNDGANPEAPLTLGGQGALFGTTEYGGNVGEGTVYKLTPPAAGQTQWTETILYNFTGKDDGSDPGGVSCVHAVGESLQLLGRHGFIS